ncbi:MAG TPA: transglutaminaseTgpA domain-containing protein [Acidimicrobiales bacterium]
MAAVPAAGLAALAGAAFTSAFAAGDLTVPVAAGAVGGAAVSAVVTGRGRRRLAVATLAALAVLVPLAMAATRGGPADVLTGLRDGLRSIVTSAVPTPADAPELVVPYAVTAAAAFLGAEAAQRAQAAAGPVLPSLVALVGALTLGLDGTRPPGWVPAAWAGLAAAVVGLRQRAGRAPANAAGRGGGARSGGPDGAGGDQGGGDGGGRSSRRRRGGGLPRRALTLVPVAMVAGVVGHLVGPHLPGAGQRDRFELRDHFEQPIQPQQQANPLVLMAGLQEGDDDPMFVAETSERVDRWRLATLDAYDGEQWSSAVSFEPAGRRLPEPPADEVSGGRRVTQTIEPVGLEGLWLPVAGRPVEVSVDDVLFDTESGVLLTAEPRLPESYRATSIIPETDPATLAGARAADDEEAERALELPPNVPPEFTDLAETITAGSSSAYMRATAIERYLAQSTEAVPFRLAVQAPPTGHSLGHLRCFLFDTERCQRQGSTEQFVAAYALLARAADLPTRIAVGFASSGSAGRDEVTAHDATAWVEVKFEGIGWVPFNPVPNPDVTNTPPPDVAGGGGTPDTQTPTTIPRPDENAAETGSAVEEEPTEAGGSAVVWIALGAAVVVALVTAPALVRARRRRRRRRAPDPGDRVAGAWAEAVDQLARSGVRTPPTAAVRDVVAAGRAALAAEAEPLGPLGELVNRARFARRGVAESDAAAAWELSDAFAARRRRTRSLAQRVREHFAVRSAAARLARG